jgi:hypothetical protein
MSTNLVNVNIDLTGQYCNHWPLLKILHNNSVVYNDEIVGQQTLTFDLDCSDKNTLTFVHYGKQFGDTGGWDKDDTSECILTVNDIVFDGISIGEHLKSRLVFNTHWTPYQLENDSREFIEQYTESYCNGVITFNGQIDLEFETPIYDWLILNKYKVPMSSTAYFSNYSLRWHYEEDIKIINEIKQLLNLDKNSNP